MLNISDSLCSVIMPAYNCQQCVQEAITSVLQQTHPLLELIVIDDCSTDQTYSTLELLAVQDSRIRLYRNTQNIGVAQTRNRGFDLAQGEYVALLDADDIWLPQKLELQLTQMEITSSDLCYSSYSFMDELGHSIRKPYLVPESFTFRQFLAQNYIGCSTAVIRSSRLANHRMNSTYSHEDYVFWLELLQAGCTVCGISTPLVQYRISPESRSSHKGRAALNRWKIYRNFLHFNIFQSAFYFVIYALLGLQKHIT